MAIIGDDTAQTLKALVLVLDGGFQPVVTVLVDDHPALVEAPLAVEGGLHDEREEGVTDFRQQRMAIVIAEAVIGALPEIGVRFGDDADFICRDVGLPGRVEPDKRGGVEVHEGFCGCPEQVPGMWLP